MISNAKTFWNEDVKVITYDVVAYVQKKQLLCVVMTLSTSHFLIQAVFILFWILTGKVLVRENVNWL